MSISFDQVMLFFLGLFSVRQLIADNLDIPLPKHWRWLIYNRKEPVLCGRAYKMSHPSVTQESKRSILDNLLELDTHHVKYFPNGLKHGRLTEVPSKYFINTLEASYNQKDLSIMSSALLNLILKSSLPFNEIDFILFLKSGNQILARELYSTIPEMIYICMIDSNSSFHPIQPSAAHQSSLQFENLVTLLEQADTNRHRNLNGIVVDCSVSTGGGITKAIHQFNDLIRKDNLNINPIEHAFVLQAHKEYSDEGKEFTLHRYFDMDEETRKLIYQVHAKQENKTLTDVHQHLKNHKLLRY